MRLIHASKKKGHDAVKKDRNSGVAQRQYYQLGPETEEWPFDNFLTYFSGITFQINILVFIILR